MKKNKILIIGFGYVGKYLGALFLKNNISFDVLDIKKNVKEDFYIFLKNQKHNFDDRQELNFLDYNAINTEYDYIIMCLPTPKKNNKPDISSILNSRNRIKNLIGPRTCLILESTVYPGTTRNILAKHLKSLKFIGYSSERVNPGDNLIKFENTTKVISGKDSDSIKKINKLYSKIFKKIHLAPSLEVAESSKLLENTFRSVNISLINELKMILDECKINIWDVIKSAETKEFGFMPFYPSIGFGGHCIPIDPLYFNWFFKSKSKHESKFIKVSHTTNIKMTKNILAKIKKELKILKNKKILICGLAYKNNVEDYRESRSINLAKYLYRENAKVYFYDSLIGSYKSKYFKNKNKYDLYFDCIIIVHKLNKTILNKIDRLRTIVFDSTNDAIGLKNKVINI